MKKCAWYKPHDWGKWSNPIDTYNSGHKQQWRVCENCGKAVFRTLKWDKQSNTTDVINALGLSQNER